MQNMRTESGFTLIEIAIVLLIVTILLGYTVAMFPVQQDLKKYREVNAEMDSIIESLVGFAQINGRLPCPDTSAGAGTIDGQEDTLDLINNVTGVVSTDTIIDDCEAFSGFLPSMTLGLNGDFSPNGNLLDPWGEEYRYHVSEVDTNADGDANTAAAIDIISPNGIREEGLSSVIPDLFVCSDSSATGDDLNCTDASSNNVVTNVAAVIISTGKDAGRLTNPTISNIQAENLDDFHDGTDDKVYIYSSRSDASGAQYDDVVKWISPNLLFTKMIEAEQLP